MIFANGAHTTTNEVPLDGSARAVSAEYNMAGNTGAILAACYAIGEQLHGKLVHRWSQLHRRHDADFVDGCESNGTFRRQLLWEFVASRYPSPWITFFNLSSPISPEDGGAPNIPVITPFPADPPITSSSPVISVWYGDNQTFGQNGIPQTWVNILGSV